MKLVKCGRYKIEDNYSEVTLSKTAIGIIEGTKEELSNFEKFMMEREWGELAVEPEECDLNNKNIMIYSDMYSFDIGEIQDFKDDFKLFKKNIKKKI